MESCSHTPPASKEEPTTTDSTVKVPIVAVPAEPAALTQSVGCGIKEQLKAGEVDQNVQVAH